MTSREKRLSVFYFQEHAQRIALIEANFAAICAAAALRFKAGVS